MSDIKRIPVSKLEVGMYVAEKSRGIADGRLQEKGFIRREETLHKLQQKGEAGAEVFIDVSKGKDSAFALPVLDSDVIFKSRVQLKTERAKANRVYGEARGLIGDILQDVKLGKAIDVTPVADLAEDINQSILSNPNALMCLSRIRDKDKYLLEHSINVGILMSIFATHLGYAKDIVKELTTGALLHDIGKIRVPTEILNKPGKLESDEWEEMKRHVVYGNEALEKSPGISDIAKSICALHHERLDGSGYPLGLPAEEISIFGRMAAIVDVYDAITASRVYHEGMCPFKAMKFLLGLSDKHLDKGLVYNFIRCMSVYPVGTLVELDNAKLAVVIETNLEQPDRPRVKVIFDTRERRYQKEQIVDLSAAPASAKIVRTKDPDDYGISLADYM